MKDSISQCIESFEAAILSLEDSPSPDQLKDVLEVLGISHLKPPSAQVIALLDMLADGITPINEGIITSLLGLCEAQKRFLYSMAGLLEEGVAAIEKAKEISATETVAEEVPSQMAVDHDIPVEPVPDDVVKPEAKEKTAPQAQKAEAMKPQSISSIRVATDRLDRVIELVGKLMVTYAVISQGNTDSSNKTSASLVELDKVIGNLQKEVDAIRLVPLKQIFMPMHRLVKSLSQKVSKKVKFTVIGEDLALDKSIVEMLNEPLVHLLRNAVDHGLEDADERREAAKDDQGAIDLIAYRKGEVAYIEVVDDGRGLNPEKIRNKAIEKDLMKESEEFTDKEILQFVLRSGFSTAEKITDVSGRGVGMDAVLNVIKNQLDGDIEIESELGKGAKFIISIPLSRSANEGIVEALVCRIGTETFIIPSRDVVEIYVPTDKDVVHLPDGRETVDVRGEVYSLLRLADYLDVQHEFDEMGFAQAVVVRVGEIKAAILVDEVLKQQQVVITGFTVPVQEIFDIPILGYGMMGESDAMVVDTEGLIQNFAVANVAAL